MSPRKQQQEENSVLMSLRELKRIEHERVDEEERAARLAVQRRRLAEEDKRRDERLRQQAEERRLLEMEIRARAEAEARLRVEAEAAFARKRLEIELARATAVAEPEPGPIVPEGGLPPRRAFAWILAAGLALAVIAQAAVLFKSMSDRSALKHQIAELKASNTAEPRVVADPAPAIAEPDPMEPGALATIDDPDPVAEPTGNKPNKPNKPEKQPEPDHRLENNCPRNDPLCGAN